MSARPLRVTVISAEYSENLPRIPVVSRCKLDHTESNDYRQLEPLSDDSDFWTSDWRSNLLDVLESSANDKQVGYVVPGHPMLGDATIQALLEADARGQISLELYDEPLPVVLTELLSSVGGPPAFVDGLTLIERSREQPFDAGTVPFTTSQSVVIGSVSPARSGTLIAGILSQWYRNPTEVRLIPMVGDLEQVVLPLDQVQQESSIHPYYLVLPPVQGDNYQRTADDLQRIVARLRAPGGCPWDREQTNQSLSRNLIEESYELLDAIERDDPRAIREELGDFLLQAIMHAQILRETQDTTLEDVIQSLTDKLIRRHPHVFAEHAAENSEAVVQTWDDIKRAERAAQGKDKPSSPLGDIPGSLPALLRLQSVLKRSARTELDDSLLELAIEQTSSSIPCTEEQDLVRRIVLAAAEARSSGVDLEHSVRAWTNRYEKTIAEALSVPDTAD